MKTELSCGFGSFAVSLLRYIVHLSLTQLVRDAGVGEVVYRTVQSVCGFPQLVFCSSS